MSQTTRRDLEGGTNQDHGHRDHPQSTPNQPFQGESNFGDSSGPVFSIYSKAAEDEDNKMVERWQKDADGILIFTGLFSAAVAALLAVTVQDLRPNSQDTSAFYLGNIYEVLADPNSTRSSIPSPVAKPPPFSPPRYAVWVNSLWFLSLVMSVSCALWATSLHQWARRYIRLTQPARCSPEKRARIRAFFANGVDEMHIPWAVEGLPTLLHLSLFLFFGGLVIFLFHVDQEVFTCVVIWIGLFSMVYGLITLLPLFRQDSPYYAPLSIPVWLLYAGIPYLTFKVLAFITSFGYGTYLTLEHRRNLRDRYRGWMLGGVEKKAEEMAEERSSEIDGRILGWTISALGDDDSLEKFFQAIPGLFTSKLVKNLEKDFPEALLETFWSTLNGFIGRTLSSNSVTESIKSRRDIICRDILGMIPCPNIHNHVNLHSHFIDAPVSVEGLQVMARWVAHPSPDVYVAARIRASKNFPTLRERDDRWIALASNFYGLTEQDLHRHIALGGDNVLLAILIYFSRRCVFFNEFGILEALARFDIRQTVPGLRHDFCTLWNELVQEARSQGRFTIPVGVLREIRHLYLALHQGTDAAPTAFSASTENFDVVLLEPSSFPLCDISSHRPDSTTVPLLTRPQAGDPPDTPPHRPHHSTSNGSTLLRQEATIIAGPPSHDLTISRDPAATSSALPVHTTDTSSLGAVAVALEDTLPNAGSHALLNGTTSSRLTISATIPRLRARGLVNTGGMCFVNAVLQLLVHSPPLWNLFRELGDRKRQRGAGRPETGGGSTPLVDATIRFFEEFMFNEKEPPQQDATGKLGEDAEEKIESKVVDPFEPTYLFDAIKEKRQLKTLLDGQQQDAEEFYRLYLEALDEELLAPLAPISSHKLTTATPGVEDREVFQPGLTDVGKRCFTPESAESPLMHIFGGKFRSTVRAPYQPDTVTIEDWRSLQLNVQPDSVHTVQDSIVHISQTQPLEVVPSSSIEASQQVLIEALPPVLVLHLKRFLHDPTMGGIVKIGKPVQFTPELEFPPEIMAPIAGKSGEQTQYKLYGVLYHHGESASNGHYTVDVLHSRGDSGGGEGWLHIDDEAVSVVRHEDVFGGHDNKRACAYMLFYCRTTPART